MLLIGTVFIILALVEFARSRILLGRNELHLEKRTKLNPRIAVLVPARNESQVIEGLLKSIKQQTHRVDFASVYIIVESEQDPTVEIAKSYGANVIVREKLNHRRRKGYALDEAVKMILRKGEHYDLYFVFDADNILSPNYIEKMLMGYREGYELATGYRMAKNANQSVVAAASTLTFAMVNATENAKRVRQKANIVFSGTGCFVSGEVVEKWGGWPFHELTEDYEMSLFATWRGLTTDYNEEAVFYDEQPLKFGQTVTQRVRWIRGYFRSRKKFIPLIKQRMRKIRKTGETQNYGSLVREETGVKPFIWLIIGVVLATIGGVFWCGWWVLAGVLLTVYLILILATIRLLMRERTKFTRAVRVKLALYNPFYLISYIPCAIRAMLAKKVSWDAIEHVEKEVS